MDTSLLTKSPAPAKISRTGGLRTGGLTVAQAAGELGYGEASFRNKISQGTVVVERIGRNLRIFREDNRQLWKDREALGFAQSPQVAGQEEGN